MHRVHKRTVKWRQVSRANTGRALKLTNLCVWADIEFIYEFILEVPIETKPKDGLAGGFAAVRQPFIPAQ